MPPRDEFRSPYKSPNAGLRWALAVVSVIAFAAVITSVALWVKSRPAEHIEGAVPRGDLEQITGQEVRQKFPGSALLISCPSDLPPQIGASEDCVMKRGGRKYRITLHMTDVKSASDATWHWTLGEELTGS